VCLEFDNGRKESKAATQVKDKSEECEGENEGNDKTEMVEGDQVDIGERKDEEERNKQRG
jgi:hypothetical protein